MSLPSGLLGSKLINFVWNSDDLEGLISIITKIFNVRDKWLNPQFELSLQGTTTKIRKTELDTTITGRLIQGIITQTLWPIVYLLLLNLPLHLQGTVSVFLRDLLFRFTSVPYKPLTDFSLKGTIVNWKCPSFNEKSNKNNAYSPFKYELSVFTSLNVFSINKV